MGFNQRTAVPLKFSSSPLLPQADSAQGHDIPTGVSPTTAKTHDWIAYIAARTAYHYHFGANAVGLVLSMSAPGNTGVVVFVNSVVAFRDVTDCAAGDVIHASFCTNLELIGNSTLEREIRLVALEDYGGSNTQRLTNGVIAVTGNNGDRFGGVSLSTSHTVITPGTTRVLMQAGFEDTTGVGLYLNRSYALTVTRYGL